MAIDILIGIGAILAIFRGWRKGLVAAILSLVAVLVGLLVSVHLGAALSDYLVSNNIISGQYAVIISFIVLFIACILLFRFLIKSIEGLLKITMLGWANRLAGAALYTLVSLFVLSSIFWLSNTLGVITPTAKQESKAYSFVEPIAPKVIEFYQNNSDSFAKIVARLKEISGNNK
jgi:membrane protein required for colicin V production